MTEQVGVGSNACLCSSVSHNLVYARGRHWAVKAQPQLRAEPIISPVSEPQITIDIARRLATEGNRSGPSAFPDHLEKLAVEVEVLNSNSGKLGTAQSGIE